MTEIYNRLPKDIQLIIDKKLHEINFSKVINTFKKMFDHYSIDCDECDDIIEFEMNYIRKKFSINNTEYCKNCSKNKKNIINYKLLSFNKYYDNYFSIDYGCNYKRLY